MIINGHKGKRKGKTGITIHILDQKNPKYSKTLTIHNVNIDELYEKIKFFLTLMENDEVTIKWKTISKKKSSEY